MPRRSLHTPIDNWFGYKPQWVWIYSGLYYPMIIVVIFTVHSLNQYVYITFNFLLLLVSQMAFFLCFPVETPLAWRNMVKNRNLSEKFLSLVIKIDGDSNCFPSMHVSTAMLTAMHLLSNAPYLGYYVFLFPILIALSALYTKRHFFADLIPGALLGYGIFKLHELMYIN